MTARGVLIRRNNPLNATDPSGLVCLPHLPSPGDLVEGFVEGVSEGLGDVAGYIGEHRVGILKGGALLLAVAAVPATGGTSLALGAGALGLSTTAELVDNRPCKSQRVVQSLALGGAGLTVGALWVGAGQSAGVAGNLASIDVAGRIGSGFSAGSVLTNFIPSPECDC